MEATIDLKNSSLWVKHNKKVPITFKQLSAERTFSIISPKKIELAPRTNNVLPCLIYHGKRPARQVGPSLDDWWQFGIAFEPRESLFRERGLHVANAIVENRGPEEGIPLCLLNISEEAIVIPKGTRLAYLRPLSTSEVTATVISDRFGGPVDEKFGIEQSAPDPSSPTVKRASAQSAHPPRGQPAPKKASADEFQRALAESFKPACLPTTN